MPDQTSKKRNRGHHLFHLPGGDPYDPLHAPSVGATPISAGGYASLPAGSEVTIHGRGRYEVARTSFHVGQPDEQPGLHVFLKEEAL